MISIESYSQLVILEQENHYSMKFIDNKGKIKLIKFFNKENKVNEMIELLKLYFKIYKVNGFNQLIPVYNTGNNIDLLPTVFLANGTKKINIKTKSNFFRIFSMMVLADYGKNKEKISRNTDIKEIYIDSLNNSSKFLVKDNIVNLTLDADIYMNIQNYERQFIMDLLEYRCSSKRIDIELVQEKKDDKGKYIVSCEDFKMIFPREYTYSFIVRIVKDHNNKINKIRKRR